MKRKRNSLWTLVAYVSVFVLMAHVSATPTLGADQKIESLTKKVFPSVVKVEARNGWRKVATGVVIGKEGYIVTTALVSPRGEDFYVITSDGEEVEAEFLGMDPETHLALVKAKEKKWTPIKLGSVEKLSPGSEIAVVCYSPEEKAAVTTGVVSSIGDNGLRLNVMVIAGASGSPVVDLDGRMVGLVRGAYAGQSVVSVGGRDMMVRSYALSRAEAPSSGLALAIPVDIVEKVTSEIKETGKVRRGWLGVGLGINEDGEVQVMQVEADSPADKAGIEEGDIFLEIDNMEVTDREMLSKEIRMHKPGDRVTFEIERDGDKQSIEVELGEYSAQDIWQEFEGKFPELFRIKPGEVPEFFQVPTPEAPKIFGWVYGDRKYIGVSLQEITPELAEYFGTGKDIGLLVTKVTEDTPAQKAGIKVGDVICKADGKSIKSIDRLTRLIQGKEKGDKIKLEIVRNKQVMSVEVEVAEDKGAGKKFIPEPSDTNDKAFQNYARAFKYMLERYRCIKV